MSLSPAYFSNNIVTKLRFDNCVFSKFLTSAIHIQKLDFLYDKVFEVSQFKLKSNPTLIYDCVFQNFKLNNKDGAAINSDQELDFYNILFTKCVARNGAALYTTNSLKANYISFTHLSAEQAPSFYSYKPDSDQINISIINSDFQELEAKNANGIFYHSSSGVFSLNDCNISKCKSAQDNGGFYVSCSNSTFAYDRFSNIKSQNINGCGFFESSKSVSLFNCIFANVDQNAINPNYGNSLTFSKIKNSVKIEQTNFINNIKSQNFEIVSNETPKIYIINCCFKCKKENSIKLNASELIESQTTVETECHQHSNLNVGYGEKRTATYNPVPVPDEAKETLILDQNKLEKLEFLNQSIQILTYAVAMFGVLATVLFIYYMFYRNYLGKRIKRRTDDEQILEKLDQ